MKSMDLGTELMLTLDNPKTSLVMGTVSKLEIEAWMDCRTDEENDLMTLAQFEQAGRRVAQ